MNRGRGEVRIDYRRKEEEDGWIEEGGRKWEVEKEEGWIER